MRGFSKGHETSFAVVAIPKLFFFDAGSLTAVDVAAGASTGVVDVAEKFERFLEKNWNEEKAMLKKTCSS